MIEYRNLSVALLGAGSRRRPRWRACCSSTATSSPAAPAPASSSSASPCATSTRRATSTSRSELFTTDAESLILGADIVVELIGGIEPARSYILQALNSGADVDHRQQGAARHPRPRAVRGRRAGRRPALLRGGRRPGRSRSSGRCATASPATASSASSASSTARRTSSSTAWTPTATTFEDALADGDRPRLRRGRPDRRHRGLRRRAEGGDPREPRLPHRRCRSTPCTARASPTVTARAGARPRARPATSSSSSRSASGSPTHDGVEGVSGARAPGARAARATRSPPCTAPRTRSSSRRRPPATSCSTARAPGGVETASAVLGDLVSAARRHVAGGPGVAESTHANLPVLPIGSVHHPLPDHARRRRRAGRARRRSPALFSDHGVSVEAVAAVGARRIAATGDARHRYPCHCHARAPRVRRSPRTVDRPRDERRGRELRRRVRSESRRSL